MTIGKLALAAVRSGYKNNKKTLQQYIETVLNQVKKSKFELSEFFVLKDDVDYEEMKKCLKEIDALGVEGSKDFHIKMEKVQEIDRKLKLAIKHAHKSKHDVDV